MTTDLIKWLETERKLDGALLADMGVARADHPKLGGVVAFPYRRGGKSYAAKFRTHDKRWSSTAGVTRGLFNEEALRTDHGLPVVITEGEIDCITVIQSGFMRCVSLPDGWTAQGNKTEALLACEDDLRKSPYVIVAGDNDEAGESLPRAVANILKGHDVRSVVWPKGCKDANDVLCLHGEGEVSASLNSAVRIDPPGGFITGLSDLPPMSARRVLRTGVKEVDWRVVCELGAMSVGTGTPGMGKSTFSTWKAHRMARNENIRVGMMAFETHPHRIRDHLCRLEYGQPFDKMAPAARSDAMLFLDNHFRIVHRTYDDTGHNLGWLEEMVHALAVRDGCKLIIIDPWNEIEHLPEPGESLTNYINFALMRIRQWAEKLDVHIEVIAHPKKMNNEFATARPPFGYDIADSAAFANKPAIGWTIHGANDGDGLYRLELWNWKVRDTQLTGSSKGVTELYFDEQMMTYEAVAAE